MGHKIRVHLFRKVEHFLEEKCFLLEIALANKKKGESMSYSDRVIDL